MNALLSLRSPSVTAPATSDRNPAPPRRLPLHVVLLTNFVTPNFRPIYEALAQRVDRLTILVSTAMEGNRAWRPDFGDLDVRVQRTWTVERPRRHRLGFRDSTYIHVPLDTIGQLQQLRPDVVISGEFGFRSIFSVLYKELWSNVPLILQLGLSEHTELGKGWIRHLLRKTLMHSPEGFLVNGPSGVRYLQRLGIPADKIGRIYYCCQPGMFDLCPLDRDAEQARRLLYVGRLIDLKGLAPFIQALARWGRRNPDQHVEFTLAGSGPEQATIEALPRPANIRLRLLGECNFEQLRHEYARAGIFAFPSLSDDWGIAVNEAMASGLPVLGCTYAQAVEELCIRGATGWPFRTNYPEELDAAIQEALATTPDDLNKMRRTVRAAVENYSPSTAADQVVAAIEAARRRAGRLRPFL